jgi:hypothetical protein
LKRALPLIFASACVLLHAGAAAQRRAADEQARVVKGQVLTSTRLPAIRMRFDKRFKYVGSQKFVLYGRAQAEQHFFVDADARRRIRRMYMLQFEGYLPGIDASYNYEAKETVKLGGVDYMVNVENVPNVKAALGQQPESDAARAVAFLEGKGYSVGESVRYQRFVRLVDESKRNEFIMLYVEDAGTSQADEKAMREFRERALKGFAVLK